MVMNGEVLESAHKAAAAGGRAGEREGWEERTEDPEPQCLCIQTVIRNLF